MPDRLVSKLRKPTAQDVKIMPQTGTPQPFPLHPLFWLHDRGSSELWNQPDASVLTQFQVMPFTIRMLYRPKTAVQCFHRPRVNSTGSDGNVRSTRPDWSARLNMALCLDLLLSPCCATAHWSSQFTRVIHIGQAGNVTHRGRNSLSLWPIGFGLALGVWAGFKGL
jgi:hypothetical protein